ncbi:MAG: FMN-binding negative transcriptional regulator [Betaproteobacteria bacterium]|nr:FMN-binding negative transcriptional regulator [Betaproteobacteria bacterium]
MFSPTYNQMEDRAEVVEFMRANSFVLLVTGTGGELHASHLPCTVDEQAGELVLHLHMAKNNPQWQQFFDDEAMVVFSGPHAYVTPRWYEDKPRVPTWNYAAVHAYGTPRMVEQRDAKHASMRKLVATLDAPWLPGFDAMPAEYTAQMLGGIVTFEIPVTRIQTRWKLSQNRGRREQELIAAQLDKSADSTERALAALTRKHLVEK